MEQAILDFAKQFAYEPTVEHSETLKTYTSFLLTGMGGSHLAADIVKNILHKILLYHGNLKMRFIIDITICLKKMN